MRPTRALCQDESIIKKKNNKAKRGQPPAGTAEAGTLAPHFSFRDLDFGGTAAESFCRRCHASSQLYFMGCAD